MMRSRSLIAAGILCGLLAIAASGCSELSGGDKPYTDAEKKSFRGGPMPASVAKIFAEKMREASMRPNSPPSAGKPAQ
jgi:hypothetical protein